MKNKLIPRKILFGNPDYTGVKISPNGEIISYIAPHTGTLNIFITPKNDIKQNKVITRDTTRGITEYFWFYNSRHIGYFQDEGGNENWQLHIIDTVTSQDVNVIKDNNVRCYVAKTSPFIPNKIIIGMNKRDKRYFDLYEVNTNGDIAHIYENTEEFGNITLDNDFKIRFAEKYLSDGSKDAYEFYDGLYFRKIHNISLEDLENTRTIGFSKDNKKIYMSDSEGHDTSGLVEWDSETGKKTLIFRDKNTDFREVLFHPHDFNIEAIKITYTQTKWTPINLQEERVWHFLEKQHNGELSIESRSLDNNLWIVSYDSDLTGKVFYLFDKNILKLQLLYNSIEKIKNFNLLKMMPITVKTRDNLDLVCYLTLPQVLPKQSISLPLVLIVHGGPTVRDYFGFDILHQWLANRGYAALSVNYRGSSGFGKKFISAGDGEWGRKMQDDLIDAAKWCIKEKIANPNKIAIVGGSYGGYATLAGLTFTPDFFACGVDIVGISNLVTNIKSKPSYWDFYMSRYMKKIGGNPDTKEGMEFLKARSPINFVDQIKKPLLIAHGANDPRVKQSESEQIVSEMQKKNIPVTYLLYPDEGHGFKKPQNKQSFFAVMEKFLSKHLNGSHEEITDEIQNSSVKITETDK